jgi:hypothetical protein
VLLSSAVGEAGITLDWPGFHKIAFDMPNLGGNDE